MVVLSNCTTKRRSQGVSFVGVLSSKFMLSGQYSFAELVLNIGQVVTPPRRVIPQSV